LTLFVTTAILFAQPKPVGLERGVALLILAQEQAPGIDAAAPLLFYAFAALTCLAAWAIVLSSNIVRMAVYLLLTLSGVAGIYFMLEAEILAAFQLIVYAGGTLILIVFGVMLTSRNPFMQLKVKGWERFAGIGIGLTMTGLLVWALSNSVLPQQSDSLSDDYGKVRLIGKSLLSEYVVPFEVAAVVLLVVMIGAAYMARKRAGKS
jgi:NADH-quinone oxidoreductase subunit J